MLLQILKSDSSHSDPFVNRLAGLFGALNKRWGGGGGGKHELDNFVQRSVNGTGEGESR